MRLLLLEISSPYISNDRFAQRYLITYYIVDSIGKSTVIFYIVGSIRESTVLIIWSTPMGS